VRENVIIAYRGASYELGQWPHGYGIWSAGSGQSQPNEWWPATPEGWSAAWYRFVAIEVPGTIVQVSPPAPVPAGQPAGAPADQLGGVPGDPPAGTPGLQPFILPGGQPYLAAGGQAAGTAYAPAGYAPAGPAYAQGYAPVGQAPAGAVPWGQPYAAAPGMYRPPFFAPAPAWLNPAAVGLLIFGIVCGVIGLFPTYVNHASLASSAVELVPHTIYLAAWAAAAVLIGIGGARQKVGALLGLGVSAVTFGLFFADAGLPIAHGAHSAGMGAGLILGLVGWVACAAGSWLALGRGQASFGARRGGREIVLAAVLIGAAIGAAITFAPSWDHYVVTYAGGTQTLTEGNAFSNPGPVIVGNVAVMIAVVAVILAASLWRPTRLGWALVAGAIVPLAAQLISALIQMSESALTQLGVSQAEARRGGLTATASFTGWFWAFCIFVIALILACGWLAARPERVAAAAQPPGPVFGGPAGTGTGETAAAPTAATIQAGWPAGGAAPAGPASSPVPGFGSPPPDGTANPAGS
jgi:hypothetical protein